MKKAFLTAALTVLGLAVSAKADPITGLYDTGVDANGTPLPDGTIGDPHYTLVSVPPLNTTATMVRTSAGGYPIVNGEWLGDDSLSAWIGPVSNSSSNDLSGQPGSYDYQTTFNVTKGDTFTITGRWSADNFGSNIELNNSSNGQNGVVITGVPTTGAPVSFEQWTPFTISGTSQGTNTLDFIVDNSPTDSFDNPTGLRVEFTFVPEPSVLVGLIGASLMGFVSFWRKRK